MTILSKVCKPDKFESYNCLKLSFTSIWGLCLNFVERESFLESKSSDTLALCETNLDDYIDSGNFSVKGYLPLIWKDSIIHMDGLAVYVKEGSPRWILIYVFDCLYFIQYLTSFSSISHLLCLYAWYLILFHLT